MLCGSNGEDYIKPNLEDYKACKADEVFKMQ